MLDRDEGGRRVRREGGERRMEGEREGRRGDILLVVTNKRWYY